MGLLASCLPVQESSLLLAQQIDLFGLLVIFWWIAVVFHFGTNRTVTPGTDVEAIGSRCVVGAIHIWVCCLTESAFSWCSSRPSICIPSSIETVWRVLLSLVQEPFGFASESGCKVGILGESAFCFCSSGQSISVSPWAEIIGGFCFGHCSHLSL
jgi:hypothetical protein